MHHLGLVFLFLSVIFFGPVYCHDQVRGVSLGGHLVPEPFIDADFWEAVTGYCPAAKDIWNICECTFQNQNASVAVKKLFADHLANFIDIDNLEQKIQQTHINTIRYPISFTYFLRPFQDPVNYYKYESCGVTMDALMNSSFVDVLTMLKKNDVDVILDLHQGLGCQNGFDNGGHFGTKGFFTNANVNETIQIWKNIVDYLKYENISDLIWAFETLNEPLPDSTSNLTLLKRYTETVVNEVLVPFMSADQMIVIQPGPGNSLAKEIETYNLSIDASRVLVDFHEYVVFGNLILRTIPSRLNGIKGFSGGDFGLTKYKYFVGEWSLATTDCAQYLDGSYGGFDKDYYAKVHEGHPTFYCNKVDQVRDNVVAGFQSCSSISNETQTYPYCQLTTDLLPTFQNYTNVLCELFDNWLSGFASNPQNIGYIFWTFITGEGNSRRIQQWDYSWLVDNGIVQNLENWVACNSTMKAIKE